LVSVQQQLGNFPDTSSPITLALTRSHRLENDAQQDMATPHPAPDMVEILPTMNPICQPNPNIDATPQTGEESTHILPTTVPDPPSSPIMFPAGVILMVLPPSVESAPVQPNHVSHASRPPSSSARPHITLQVTSVQDPGVTASSGVQAGSIPMELPHHENQSKSLTPDTA
jgi:hypothetical protein